MAFENLSYRDIFVTGNYCVIGDFEGDIQLSTTQVTLPNGDTYKINAGTPVITSEAQSSGLKSLKCFGVSSSQIRYRTTRLTKTGKLFIGACIKTDRYGAGRCGVQYNLLGDSTTLIDEAMGLSAVSEDFEKVTNTIAYDGSQYNNIILDCYIGTYRSANADAYLDNVIFAVLPNNITPEEAKHLYNNYVDIISAA